MSNKSRAQLKSDSTTSFADNTQGNITAAVLRARIIDYLDSLYSLTTDDYSAIAGLAAQLTAAKDRTNHTGAQAISTVTGLQAALDAKASLPVTIASTALTDSTTYGRAVLQAASYAAIKTLLALENVDNIPLVNAPVSTLQQAALDLKADKTRSLVDLNGGTALSLNTYYFDNLITADRTITFSGSPTNGNFVYLYLSVTGAGVDLTFPESYRLAESTPITTLAVPVGEHEFFWSRVDGKWSLADTVVSDANGDVVGPASSVDSRIALWDGTTGKLLKQATLAIADVLSRANHTGTQAQSTVTNLESDLAGKQPLDADLTAIAALSPTNDDVVQRKAGAWANRSMAQLADDLSSNLKEQIGVACSDQTTAITAGTAKVTFRMPFAMTLTAVRASLSTAQSSGSIFTVDINEAGVSVLSTKLTIDNGEKTSVTAATPAVISDTALADDAEITIDVDQVGDGTALGLVVFLIGKRT